MSGAASVNSFQRSTFCQQGADWVRENRALITAICVAIIGGLAAVLYTTDFTLASKLTVGAVGAAFIVTIPLLFLAAIAKKEDPITRAPGLSQNSQGHGHGVSFVLPEKAKPLTRDEKAQLRLNQQAIAYLTAGLSLGNSVKEEIATNLKAFLAGATDKVLTVIVGQTATLCIMAKKKTDKPTDKPVFIKITAENAKEDAAEARFTIECPDDFLVGNRPKELIFTRGTSFDGIDETFSRSTKALLQDLMTDRHPNYKRA